MVLPCLSGSCLYKEELPLLNCYNMSPLLLINISTPTSISFQRRKPLSSTTRTRQSSSVTCMKHQADDNGGSFINRRNLCIGGLYGATATFSDKAGAEPVQPPDISDVTTCKTADDPQLINPVQCCPPYGTNPKIIDFKLPLISEPLRIRKQVDSLSPSDILKYKEAIQRMKDLPKDDPWNFMQQAQIHCAFCNGGYHQVGFPDVTLQIHASYLFLPWHRYYIYFWERILGKLMGDPTFAIPVWGWDTIPGMRIPEVYKDTRGEINSLFNCNRNADHYSALMDYKYEKGDPNPTPAEEGAVIEQNQLYLSNLLTEYVSVPKSFMGEPLLQGQILNAPGQLEVLHNTIHKWTGEVDSPNWDMGNFHTAARDAMFFAHHTTVDRLWSIYQQERNKKIEFNTNNWLDASFVFYDENRNVVRCKVRDCLDESKLRNSYEQPIQPLSDIRRTYFDKKKASKRTIGKLVEVAAFGTSPRVLDTTIRALVPRPKASRTQVEKNQAPEVIVIDDFKFNPHNDARFDVYIAKPVDQSVSSDLGEYVGCFNHIHTSHGQENGTNRISLGITNMVVDIEADASEQLVVSFVPRSGVVTLTGVTIELLPAE